MTFFIFYVAYRFGHLKLGPKDAQPEFSDVSYFAMLFSAGIVSLLPFRCEIAFQKICILYYIANRNLSTISPSHKQQGVGLFFFGVSEPLWNQSEGSILGNRFTNKGYTTQNEIDQWAMTMSMYHWGFAA